MSRDLQAFHQAFFDESKLLLDDAIAIVECGRAELLTAGQIAELHRCVHSIAGGAVTLGFDQPTALARALEIFIDACRGGALCLDRDAIECCADGLKLLDDSLAGLQSGRMPVPDHVDYMITRLTRPGAQPRKPQAQVNPQVQDQGDSGRTIRFVVSRALAGADLIIEHVLEDLGRLGRLISVNPPSEGREGSWCVTVESGADDTALSDVLDQIAEPGSLRIDRVVETQAEAVVQAAPSGDEHVTFWVGDQWFVVAASHLLGTDEYRGELRMPGVPPVLLGLLVFKGELIPLIDAHLALGIDTDSIGMDAPARVVSIKTRDGPIGLLVDRVGDRLTLQQAQLRQPRALRRLLTGSPVTGFFLVEEGVCACLDPDLLCVFLEGFASEVSPLPEVARAFERVGQQGAQMQARTTSSIMTGGKEGRSPRKMSARPVARRSLEEEWQNRGQ